jgi:hypothetical protein
MLIKRMAIASAAALGLLSLGYGASAGPATQSQIVSAAQQASAGSNSALVLAGDRRRYRRSRVARRRYGGYGDYGKITGRTSAGPPYDSCYMKCVQSSHPADFCQEVARQHFCY